MSAKTIFFALLWTAVQAQDAKPVFEVDSVKPATALGPMGMRADRTGGPGTPDPGIYSCRNCPVYWVLSEAYDLQPFQIAAPDWLHDSRFDFQARVPVATTKSTFKVMLQNLLTDRFKLATHRESREMVVYELSVGRNGPKFQESVPATPQKEERMSGAMARDKDGFPILPAGASMAQVPGHARIRSDNQPISWFVRMLSGQLQGPVVDATGLSGKYDFLLSWAFDDNASGSADGSVSASAPDPYRPALIAAVQSQLGLKLEQKKGRVEVLVVDHIEKQPTAN